jgi:hypothetical protein
MPIAPITGKLRKRFWLDVTCALGLGITGGYAYWYVVPTRYSAQVLTTFYRYGIHLKACE